MIIKCKKKIYYSNYCRRKLMKNVTKNKIVLSVLSWLIRKKYKHSFFKWDPCMKEMQFFFCYTKLLSEED